MMHASLDVPDGYRPLTVTAIGALASADLLPPALSRPSAPTPQEHI